MCIIQVQAALVSFIRCSYLPKQYFFVGDVYEIPCTKRVICAGNASKRTG